MHIFRLFVLSLFFNLLFFCFPAQQLSGAEIYHQIKKLNVLGNVLYLAAHPDDENTRFISYCANEKLLNTGYLSLTRGDGGQNLIGTEIREELGIIRTQELLSARRVDGGQQFFTRANDFGYSKTPEETLKIWDKQKILSDVVWVIRNFRPDVIVCRFPIDGKGGHGHHTSSALLAMEAFDLAADSLAFKEQLKHVSVWQPKRVVVNTGRWWDSNISANDPGVVSLDIGGYNHLLGTSYNELAALSRSMHKTQGFGSTGKRGEYLEFFEYLKGDTANNKLFESLDFSWDRISKSAAIKSLTSEIIRNFSISSPSMSIPRLLKLRTAISKLDDENWKRIKMKEVEDLILQCSGLYIEITTLSSKKSNEDSVSFNLEIINRSNIKMKLKSISCKDFNFYKKLSKSLKENQTNIIKNKSVVPAKLPISQPYWLEKPSFLGAYNVDSLQLIGKAENNPSAEFLVTLEVGESTIEFKRPLVFKWNDPVKGEQNKNWIVCPKVTANIDQKVMIFSDEATQKISVTLTAHSENQKGNIKIVHPQGWKVIGTTEYSLKTVDEELVLEYFISPNKSANSGTLKVQINGADAHAINTIVYDHIPEQRWFPKSKLQLVHLKLNTIPKKIGYLMGAGDLVDQHLKILKYDIKQISAKDLTLKDLKNYDVVITGVRFFNVEEKAPYISNLLLKYVNEGGNLVVQYNTSYRLKTKDFYPYPLQISRDRVTQEDAQVTFLNNSHPVMNFPNKLTKDDFNNWVQERGLYFPNIWSKEYQPIFSWNDFNEDPKKGSLLIAKYGKGYYTYTGISFFRQLPAGVSGAYKLLVNIISLNND
jgi:LmbE family N-acetylglucosaminyl deacetylase